MSTVAKVASIDKHDGIPPRERILTAAAQLFYRHGIRAVGVEAIAEAAKTNKMTLYRHFPSKDQLVAEYLRRLTERAKTDWARREAENPGNPLGQVRAWLRDKGAMIAGAEERGCPLSNAAIELPEKEHPARCVIETYKTAQRDRLVQLCAAAAVEEPELLAEGLVLLLEGARVTTQNMPTQGLGERLVKMGERLINAHKVKDAAGRSA